MIEALVEVVEGWTQALPFTLKADDVAVDLSGLTVGVYLKDNTGALVASGSSEVTVTDATAGQITWKPASTSTLRAARTPYKIRFQVTDVSTDHVWFPNVDESLLKVNEP